MAAEGSAGEGALEGMGTFPVPLGCCSGPASCEGWVYSARYQLGRRDSSIQTCPIPPNSASIPFMGSRVGAGRAHLGPSFGTGHYWWSWSRSQPGWCSVAQCLRPRFGVLFASGGWEMFRTVQKKTGGPLGAVCSVDIEAHRAQPCQGG